jgi:deoxyribonuclease-4
MNIKKSYDNNIRFGVSFKPNNFKEIKQKIEELKELNLDILEIAFLEGVFITEEEGYEIRRESDINDIALSVHSPYYINFNADTEEMIKKSKYHLCKSARIGKIMGAENIVFHPGYYGNNKKNGFDRISERIKEVAEVLKAEFNDSVLRAETMGKKREFGELEEIILLSQLIDNLLPCIDFAHLHARTQRYNSYSEFNKLFKRLEKRLGIEYIKNMHIHVSGIEYGREGEKYHLNLMDSDFRFDEWVEAVREYNIGGNIIIESPEPYEDAIMLKNLYWKKDEN